MRAQTIRTLAPDRRITADRQVLHFGFRAEQRTADVRDVRGLVLTERVGNSIIVVTHFD